MEEGSGEFTDIAREKINKETDRIRDDVGEDKMDWWRTGDREKEALNVETNNNKQ